jgi:tetratricopeptide (TPR) repeat protein
MAAYKAREDYAEGISEIYILLAAKEILNLGTTKVIAVPPDQVAVIIKRCLENLKMAESEKLLNEYTWILKGFYELLQENKKRAEELFKMVLERVTKGQAAKKKFLFIALIGLGMVSFSQSNFQSALDNFSRAISTFPDCHASVRTAISCCCFKLQQYDRARLALHRANSIDVCFLFCLILMCFLILLLC